MPGKMIKHKYNKNYIHEGESFSPNKKGIIELPVRIAKLNPIKDDAEDDDSKKIDWREAGIKAGLKDEDLEKFMKKKIVDREKWLKGLEAKK